MAEPLLPWLVVSPEYGEVIPVCDGQGPMEYGADVVFVEAASRRDALYLGVALFQRQGAKYLRDAENPYSGVKVESQMCPQHPQHGMPVWKGDYYDCPQCEALRGDEA